MLCIVMAKFSCYDILPMFQETLQDTLLTYCQLPLDHNLNILSSLFLTIFQYFFEHEIISKCPILSQTFVPNLKLSWIFPIKIIIIISLLIANIFIIFVICKHTIEEFKLFSLDCPNNHGLINNNIIKCNDSWCYLFFLFI